MSNRTPCQHGSREPGRCSACYAGVCRAVCGEEHTGACFKFQEPIRNGEGLSWEEWRDAAGFPATLESAHAHMLDWFEGVDPTEYRNAAPKRI